MIYFDNAATSFPKPEKIYEALDYANRNIAFNAGRGGYKGARKAQDEIGLLKKEICKLVNIDNSESNVLFTESATIAANILIMGLELSNESIVYVSPFEHNAIIRPLEVLRKKIGFKVIIIPFDSKLNLKIKAFKHLNLINPANYIFVTAVSNTLGNIIDINEITNICTKSNPVVIVDVAQALGLIPLDLKKMRCDYMIFASHKTMYGPFGLGGIISKQIRQLIPTLSGGTGKDSLNINTDVISEIGSVNIIAVYGVRESIKWIYEVGQSLILKKVRDLSNYLISKLQNIDDIIVRNHNNNSKNTGIVAFTHAEYTAIELAQILDSEYNICVRAGFQCAPYVHNIIGTDKIGGIIRVSFGYFNNKLEIDKLTEAIVELGDT